MKSPTIIGSRTYVTISKQGVIDVPAKVDTGADSSSIWASDIHEKNGILFFTLFGKGSSYYTGEELQADKYTVISIKNSFGHAEYRYKVVVPVVIADRRINVQFTLANRENTTYPILIGRKTLKGKFVVDVAMQSSQRDVNTKKHLIFSTYITTAVAHFAKQVESYGNNLSVTHSDYENVRITFDENGMKASLISTGEDLASFDVVHFKTSIERDITAALARYCAAHGVRVIDYPAVSNFPAMSKLYQYAILSKDGITIPRSVFLMPEVLEHAYDSLSKELGVPFILKGIHESRGRFNDVIRSEEEFKIFTKRASLEKVYLVAQVFIPNEGDYRVLVMGKKRIPLVIYRSRYDKAETHLNNTSQGSHATLMTAEDLPGDIRIASLQAARSMGRDIAGVDMVQDSETGQWYCFEVNDGPQMATGTFTTEKQQAYAAYIEMEPEI